MGLLNYGTLPNLPVVGAARAELNDLFDLAVANQLNDDNLLRNLFRREEMRGNPTGIRFRTARNATVAMGTEPTVTTALADAAFGNQGRLRGAEYAAVLSMGIAISDYMIASTAGEGGIDVVMEEIMEGVMDFRNEEERQLFAIRSGSITGESAANLVGLRHIIQDATPTPTDTDTLYGLLRTTNAEFGTLFSNAIYGATPGTVENLTQAKIDRGFRLVTDDGGRVSVLITGTAQHDNFSNLFASRQNFNDKVEVPGGFIVSTYRGVPIITSVHVPRTQGDTLIGNDASGNAGQDVFGLDLRWTRLRVLKEASMQPMAKDGPTNKMYMDQYFQLVCRKPNANFACYDLTEVPV